MKVVIKFSSPSANQPDTAGNFAQAVASLFRDHHAVAVIHGAHRESGFFPASANGTHSLPLAGPMIEATGTENRTFIASLHRTGLPVLGLCAGDGHICEVRKAQGAAGGQTVEIGQVNSRWIDIICSHRGIPVISNLVLSAWGEHYLVDSDQLAAACAKSWGADALIYLTSVDGVRDLNGLTIRWLDLNYIEFLKTHDAVNAGMLFKLTACKAALESGVHRVRILPVSHVDSLPSFFFSRIDFGTEVIASTR